MQTYTYTYSALSNLPVTVTIDGIVADGTTEGQTHNAHFSYTPPTITNITAPPVKGGTMIIYGNDFGQDESKIKVTVLDQGCPRDCPGVELITEAGQPDYVQCQFDVTGVFKDCNRTAAITVTRALLWNRGSRSASVPVFSSGEPAFGSGARH